MSFCGGLETSYSSYSIISLSREIHGDDGDISSAEFLPAIVTSEEEGDGRTTMKNTKEKTPPEENDSKEKEKPTTSHFVNPQEVVYFSNRFHTTAILPVFPPGVLSLLGALLVFFGIGFLTYVAIAQGDALNERMDAAAIALNNMIHRLWHGEISSLNLLVVHPDVRAWAGMYLGAIVAAAGFYFVYVMVKQQCFFPSFLSYFKINFS